MYAYYVHDVSQLFSSSESEEPYEVQELVFHGIFLNPVQVGASMENPQNLLSWECCALTLKESLLCVCVCVCVCVCLDES